jgi:hypothetical protein
MQQKATNPSTKLRQKAACATIRGGCGLLVQTIFAEFCLSYNKLHKTNPLAPCPFIIN